MTVAIAMRAFGEGMRRQPGEEPDNLICPAKSGVDSVHTYVCFIGWQRRLCRVSGLDLSGF